MKNNKINKIIIFYPAYEKGGATKILENLINFFTSKKININLISCNAKYSDFTYKDKYFKITKPKSKLQSIFFQRILFTLSVLKVYFREIVKNDKNTIIFSMQSHLLPVIIGRILNKKIIVRNSEDPFGATRFADNRFYALLIFLTKFLSFNLANGIITNSTTSLKSISFFLFNKRKVILIFNPYLKKINNIIPKKNKKNFMLAIGRFTKQKNFLFLINTFNLFVKKYDNYNLTLVGSGKDEKKITHMISKLGLKKKIRVLKWTKNLTNNFKNSKFFILPSLYEGSPNILIDTIDSGIPCIASDCSGVKDILMNGKIGIVYNKTSKIDLLESMIKMHNNFNFYQKKSIKYMNSSNRFLIKPQSQKYLNFLSKFI